MNHNDGLNLIVPRITPVLDAAFRPAVLANRAFREQARASQGAVPVELALEQADGSVFRFKTGVLPQGHSHAAGNFIYIERMVKFLLWSRGGFRIYFNGPKALGQSLQKYYRETPTGKFDSDIIGSRIYDRPIEVVITPEIPAERANTTPLGRHLDGCRIGFDLGGSDRKVAAVIDGKVVFSEETVWDPVKQTDPQYHYDGIMHSLKLAAKHLPRVDAIGGSSAGVYVNNRVKVASLFRGISPELFQSRVKDMFLNIQKEWNNVPFEVVNDGEVTALAGSMSLGQNGVLGIALGTSTAGGFVNMDGNITSWLNELAFMPVDYNPAGPVDEWSGDYGCGVQYFSQQGVGRLLPAAGIEVDAALPLPEKLKHVQELMLKGDPRAQKIYQTIGTCLGYAMAHYADFYDFKNVLILGRVTSGPGGDVLIAGAKEVLNVEFPGLAGCIAFHIPDEKDKRHGQAIAAASLPKLP
ncbi:MAG TPA: ROK family protein [Verrucomicrobiae bacterium]|nr:ROK family protein [Verrucomicrobiae bacterium]